MAEKFQSKISNLELNISSGHVDLNQFMDVLNDINKNNKEINVFHSFLDLAHLPEVTKMISSSSLVNVWLEQLIDVIKKSNYHLGILLRQRAKRYKSKIAFQIIKGDNIYNRSYDQIWYDINKVAKSLISLENSEKLLVVGILAQNEYRAAILDLACLSFGIRVVPIPLNTTSKNLEYIIKNSDITDLFIGGKTAKALWKGTRNKFNVGLISFDNLDHIKEKILDWDSFIESGRNLDIGNRLNLIPCDWTCTVMYTSGTTNYPKGICFNQINIISKRFSRALALPKIGPDDIFLSYLPLFHTFGRYFELIGTLYWGATYVFAEAPSFNSLLKDFKKSKPTIFISIPKRWVQLYDTMEEEGIIDSSDENLIRSKIMDLTGGNLKLGLSAAGYLDPDIFKFFQNNGVNLLSGYGMTEATGGITMTPPGDYIPDSVGKALPGIKLKLTKEGELYMKGAYVSDGYFKEKKSFDFQDGWFYSGDIFKKKNGHYFILDRKKDIYKNSRGQTIAPQKIENLFQDFDLVNSVFLVGDGKEYNTVLIHPNYDNDIINLEKASLQEMRDLFSSIILSVNTFLSPFERIINYAIIDRDFSEEMGEVTSKKSLKRKKIIENFSDIIKPMYVRNYVPIHYGPKEVRIPNWLLREVGALRTDVNWNGSFITFKQKDIALRMTWEDNDVKIGSFYYETELDIIDLESIIKSPSLWLGNKDFVAFVGDLIFRLNEIEIISTIKIKRSMIPWGGRYLKKENVQNEDIILLRIHSALCQFIKNDDNFYENLVGIIDDDRGIWTGIILDTFLIYQDHPKILFQIKLLEAIGPLLSGKFFVDILMKNYQLFKSEKPEKEFLFNIERTNYEHYKGLISFLKNAHANIDNIDKNQLSFIQKILLMVSDFAVKHPTSYIGARSELIWWQLSDVPKPLFSTAQRAFYALSKGFRDWIGPPISLSINRETGAEITWQEVIKFDNNVSRIHQQKIIEAIVKTSLIRESIFIFSKNTLIQLDDIARDGVWITHIGSRNKKHVFRLLIKTLTMGTHNVVLNLNDGLERSFLEEEIKWLITMGSGYKDQPLVENFGGFWPEHDLYTEEYITVETLDVFLEMNRDDIQDKKKLDRWQMRWLHFIWNGIQAYQEFWYRTNFKYEIHPPIPENLTIPLRDYSKGTKIISISGRTKTRSISQHFLDLYTDYIVMTEKKFPGLKHMSNWEVIFTATIQALKVKKGINILKKLRDELNNIETQNKFKQASCNQKRITNFLEDLDNFGVLTKPLVFASLRYKRWLDLNVDATKKARASILQDLYQDYQLDEIIDEYPETRVRFFMMTCFQNMNEDLRSTFQKIIKGLRENKINSFNIKEQIDKIEKDIDVTEEEKFYLARMLFPHVSAADYVELVSTVTGDEKKLNLVFRTKGNDGQVYKIRPPFLPKEIARFHSLLSDELLAGKFTSNHEFLLIFNSRNRLAGGLYWKNLELNRVHIEWVAIKNNFRGLSLSQRLLAEYYERMRQRGINTITVGFYLENFFYKQGFEINKQYGGLVKTL
tara:strand:- start:3025 stop:7596 length:4572 start_codon:yes stop_codon:yes gene_type:complete